MDLGTEERRTAIEVIATLVYHIDQMAKLILEPAGIPLEVYRPILIQRNSVTGRRLSKREMAPIILKAMEARPDGSKVILEIIKIAASWSEDKFILADRDDFKARAAVQKARSLLPNVQRIEAQEAKLQEPKNRE